MAQEGIKEGSRIPAKLGYKVSVSRMTGMPLLWPCQGLVHTVALATGIKRSGDRLNFNYGFGLNLDGKGTSRMEGTFWEER